jgi:uncharacterized membrane protein
MNNRPISITITSCILILAGTVGLLYHGLELTAQPFEYEPIWVCLVRSLAIVCGVFMLRGANWARWVSVIWLGYHVILSGFHSLFQSVVHGLILAVFAYLLFRPQASAYFRSGSVEQLQNPDDVSPS